MVGAATLPDSKPPGRARSPGPRRATCTRISGALYLASGLYPPTEGEYDQSGRCENLNRSRNWCRATRPDGSSRVATRIHAVADDAQLADDAAPARGQLLEKRPFDERDLRRRPRKRLAAVAHHGHGPYRPAVARGHFDPRAVADRHVSLSQAAVAALGLHGNLLASQDHRRLCPGGDGRRAKSKKNNIETHSIAIRIDVSPLARHTGCHAC